MKDTSEPERTVQNFKNKSETSQTNCLAGLGIVSRLPKTHVDYWFSRLKKRSYVNRQGQQVEIPDWQVQLQHAGRQLWFNLGTPNQAAAARKAKEVFIFLDANGWDATLARFKPGTDIATRINVTVGDFLQAARDTGKLRPPTFMFYQNAFRTIVSEVFGVKGDASKFDYRGGGNRQWQERIDAIRLERLTPARIIAWQQKRLRLAGNSPVAIASAKRTANTLVRCARSLFSPRLTKLIKTLQLPKPMPFDGVEMFESGSTKYVSKVDVRALIAAARNELKPNEPEVYKAFLLGLFAGMRKGEIDLAEWGMMDWAGNTIRLEQTEWLHLKTQDSAGEITVDPEVMGELKEMLPGSQGPFIIVSNRLPRNDSARPYYRCEPIFDRLTTWLRSKGVAVHKPLHELRKEIGALVATEHGIYAASRFLRHSDITTTARHYADHKTRISVGLGKLLHTAIKPAAQPAIP